MIMESTQLQLIQHAKDELSPPMLRQYMSMIDGRSKSTGVGIALALLIGGLGAHKFYTGENVAGIAYLLTATVGWVLVVPPIIIAVLCIVDAFMMKKTITNYNKVQGYRLVDELKMIES